MSVETRGRALYLPGADALAVADLHVGRAAAARASVPVDERADLRDRLGAAVGAVDPETVVFAGDLLHRFSAPTPAATRTLRTLAGAVRAAGARPVAVAGNHDAGLASAWPGPVDDAHRLPDGTVVCHGHGAPGVDAERYVCGHVHPAITVAGRKRPCFLRGTDQYRGREVVVVPAFSRLAAGVRVERRDALDSPLLPRPGALRPGVVDGEETLWFPPLDDLRPHL